MKLQPTALALAAPVQLSNIGFVAGRSGPRLVGSAFGTPGPALFDLLLPDGRVRPPAQRSELATSVGLQMGSPQWHACHRTDGALAVVLTTPGSASSGVAIDSSHHGTELPVSSRTPLGVFFRPRWIKGACQDDATLVAITADSNERQIVRFAGTSDLKYGDFEVLHQPTEGRVESIEVVQQSTGYRLLYKAATPSSSYRTDASQVSWFEGRLRSVPYDTELAPRGEAADVPGTPALFDFDADPSGDEIVIAATSRHGLTVWRWSPERGDDGLTVLGQYDSSLPLTQPRVTVRDGMVHYAVVEPAPPDDIRVLVGRLPAR